MIRLTLIFLSIVLVYLIPLFFFGYSIGIYCVLLPFTPYLLYAASYISLPIEKKINNKYISLAKVKLSTIPIKIAITGSFGKTSCKNILTILLKEKFDVIATKKNFNTPMGICLSSKKVTPDTQVFIAELGARHVGDIDELMNIVQPNYALLVSIGNQHLETFGSMENIIKEKCKVVNLMSLVGKAVVNQANPFISSTLFDERREVIKVNNSNIGYSGYTVDEELTSHFVYYNGKQEIAINTKLIGEHNACNAVLAIPLALLLGVSPSMIQSSMRNIIPGENRCSIQKINGITIIDDSYNCSVESTKSALALLNSFQGRKLVTTSGLVELGKKSALENFNLGKNIASVSDVAIVIKNKNTRHLICGINSSDKKITLIKVKNTAESTTVYSHLLIKGDILLIMSDLPQKYSL